MKYEISVTGMKCQNCAKSIENRLKSIDGLLNCYIDIKNGTVTVELNEGGENLDKIKSAISDLGFDVA